MDAIDKRILMVLQNDAKANIKIIAEKSGLSVSPTLGYIKKYVALLDEVKIGKSIQVFCQVTLSIHSKEVIDNFKKQIAKLHDVMGCYHVSGNYDFLLKIAVKDMNEYQQFAVEKLSVIEGISNVQSTFVLEEIKNEVAHKLQ